jgi:hypothetical protein
MRFSAPDGRAAPLRADDKRESSAGAQAARTRRIGETEALHHGLAIRRPRSEPQ